MFFGVSFDEALGLWCMGDGHGHVRVLDLNQFDELCAQAERITDTRGTLRPEDMWAVLDRNEPDDVDS
jgi:hypothetical protein